MFSHDAIKASRVGVAGPVALLVLLVALVWAAGDRMTRLEFAIYDLLQRQWTATPSDRVLLVDTGSRSADGAMWNDPRVANVIDRLDAAGAAVIQPAEGDDRGVLSMFLRSDGKLAPLLYRPGGGASDPISAKVVEERSQYMKMAGREVFKAAVRTMAQACDEALTRAGVSAHEIDLLVPHQANIRILEATAKHAGVPMEKVMVNVDRYGNTSSASIPLALEQGIAEGRIKEGSLLLLVAFGAGFTWGSAVVRW